MVKQVLFCTIGAFNMCFLNNYLLLLMFTNIIQQARQFYVLTFTNTAYKRIVVIYYKAFR